MATLWVEFDGLRVAVRSAAPEVALEVERAFRAMIVRNGELRREARLVAELEVDRVGDGYRVAGSGLATPEHGPLPEARRALRYHTTRAFLEARPERFWVHAAAARRGDRAVLVPGNRGRGKSTLVTALARAGWQYLSDEAVPLDMTGDLATPFPVTPHVRVAPGLDLPPAAVAALERQDVELGDDMICREAVRITELVLVRYAPGSPRRSSRRRPGRRRSPSWRAA